MIDAESSQRINILRFPLIVLVVFIHAYPHPNAYPNAYSTTVEYNFLTEFIRNVISQGFARTAVPLFFLISGYLFFAGIHQSKANYLKKIKSRIHRLLIPFLFWNITVLILILVVQAIPKIQPFSPPFFLGQENASIYRYGYLDYLRAIFGVGRLPIAYQFWFIRDLMLLVMASPIIMYTKKITPLPFVVGLFILWLLGIWPIFAPSGEATLFFYIGAYLALSKKNLFFTDMFFKTKYGTVIVGIYLLIVAADSYYIGEIFSPYLHRIGVAVGVVTVLFLTKSIIKLSKLKRFILEMSKSSFFVFATHEPLLTIFRKVSYKIIVTDSSFEILVLYFLIPIIIITILVLIYQILLRLTPKLINIITGKYESA